MRPTKKRKYLSRAQMEDAEAKRAQAEAEAHAQKAAKARAAAQSRVYGDALYTTTTTTSSSSSSSSSGGGGSKDATRVQRDADAGGDADAEDAGDAGDAEDAEGGALLPVGQVKAALRARGHVVTYFGESDSQRQERLRKVQMAEGEFKTGEGNAFSRALVKESQKLVEDALEATLRQESGGSGAAGEAAGSGGAAGAGDSEELAKLAAIFDGKLASNTYDTVLFYLARLLYLWGADLKARTVEERSTLAGKRMTATYAQTVEYLDPLFAKLKAQSLDKDILGSLAAIVKELAARDYINAMDHFLAMSIGNAAWPIGVTMVGIHTRSGRERISTDKVAHVLNDDVSRKYIQSVKRLITWAQSKFPPADAARKIG